MIQVYADPQSDNLGVSLRQRLDPMCLPQLFFELVIVFNESVVNKCDALPLIIVGVCVHVGLITVGRPSSVAQPDVMLVSRSPL